MWKIFWNICFTNMLMSGNWFSSIAALLWIALASWLISWPCTLIWRSCHWRVVLNLHLLVTFSSNAWRNSLNWTFQTVRYIMFVLNCWRPMFAYVNTCRGTPLEIHFIYLDKKENYWKSFFQFWKKLCLLLRDIKCGHKIEVACAQFLNTVFASVHLSVVLRYIYYI